MEQVVTPSILENILSQGEQDIIDPVEDVANLELIDYSKRRQAILKQTQNRKIIEFGQHNYVHN